MQGELKSLEEEHKKAKSTMEEVQQSANLGEGALWNKNNQESLKKLQLKLTYECEDLRSPRVEPMLYLLTLITMISGLFGRERWRPGMRSSGDYKSRLTISKPQQGGESGNT